MRLLILFIAALLVHSNIQAQHNQAENREDVTLLILRDKSLWGGVVKWQVRLVDGATYENLPTKKADQYLAKNKIGKIGQKEFIELRIPANEEKLVYIGNHYAYIKGEPGSIIYYRLKGLEREMVLEKGKITGGIGVFIPEIFDREYEEISLEADDQVKPFDLANYTKRALDKK